MAARLLGLAIVLMLVLPVVVPGDEGGVAVIVHPERRDELSVADVVQIYLRRKRFWGDGEPIVPLNLPTGTPLRQRFSLLVLRQSDARLADYWNRQYFFGILPPSTLASTEAVRRYVASDPKSIGYVPASEIDGSVRVLLRFE